MRRLTYWLASLYYSLPVQAVVVQLAHHRVLLLFWLALLLIATGALGGNFGIPYLFWEPEYAGGLTWVGMVLLGVGMGIFTLAYHMTAYILDAHRYPFLAQLRRPFRVFCFNNSLIPLVWWLSYSAAFVAFQRSNPALTGWQVAGLLAAFWAGSIGFIFVAQAYFTFTNKNISALLGERIVGLAGQARIVQRRRLLLDSRTRVESYYIGGLRRRRVSNAYRGDLAPLERMFAQNHGNSVLVMLFLLIALLVLGLLQDVPALQLPAAVSICLLLAVAVMVVGAFAYWFRRLGLLIVLGLVAGGYFLNSAEFFVGRYYAYGLDYEQPPAPYDTARIAALAPDSAVIADRALGIAALEAWRARAEALTGQARPRLLLICSTGGGLRSATWSLTALQAADSALDGRLLAHTRLLAGASGGVMGAAYYRELAWARMQGSTALPHPNSPEAAFRISQDLLNPVASRLATGALSPPARFEDAGRRYYKERGYSFEKQFVANTGAFAGRRLADYAAPEAAGLLPQLVLTPAIINDGRQLVISALPVAWLSRPLPAHGRAALPAAVELRRLLARQHADSLLIVTALRMNASFPLILPYVELPTEPPLEVMDAGVTDNIGTRTALKYLFVFQDWIRQHTSGAVLLILRDAPPPDALALTGTERSQLSRFLTALTGTYNSFAKDRLYQHDEALGYARAWFGPGLSVVELTYTPAPDARSAALNFHLTEREKLDIRAAIRTPANRAALARLRALAGVDSLPAKTAQRPNPQ